MLRSSLVRALPALALLTTAAAQCELTRLTPPDAEVLDVFGWCVDLDGARAIVGSVGADDVCPNDPNCNSGAAFICEEGPGGWVVVERLTGSDVAMGDQFGQDVSVSGDRAVVGAHFQVEGAAYVFVRTANGWVEEQKLSGSDSQPLFHFGHSVTIDGDTVLVGVMRDDHQGIQTGAAFIFERVGSVWTETRKLVASDAAAMDLFARASDLDGDVAVIGAHLHDGAASDSGAAYVYERDENGTPGDPLDDLWVQAPPLATSTPLGAGALFGRSVAASGDRVAVGASADDVGGAAAGAVYVFERTSGGWVETQRLVADDAAAGDKFGESVTIDGDRIVVGAVGDADFGARTGAAYVFELTGAGWVQTQKLLASDAAANADLGAEMGVSLSGDVVLCGARFNGAAAQQAGAAYAFDLSGCLGEAYCVANANSTGVPGETSASGSTVAERNALTVTVSDLPLSAFGLFIVSAQSDFFTNPGGSAGNLCLGGTIGRYVNDVFSTGASGSASLVVDLTAVPSSIGPFQAVAGDTIYFQAWHRDVVGGAAGSNFAAPLAIELH